MAELFLEILSEEIPARMQVRAAEQLRESVEAGLKEAGLFHERVQTSVTPRRLVLSAENLSLTQEDRVVETRGPRVGAPEQALEGFVRSVGLTKDQLQVRETDKGEFYFAVAHEKGKPTRDILKSILEDTLDGFHWPKSMRWGSGAVRWVRPIQNIACVFGGDVLPVQFGELVANDNSTGHRFLGTDSFKVTDRMSHIRALKDRYVMLDMAARKEKIVADAREIAASKGLTLVEDDSLLEEVAGLVEWPNVLLGTIEDRFMELPEEVLISSIRTHQKYFCTRDKNGKLAPFFIVVSNMIADDDGAAIIAGNERVLRARLSDAVFFWDQDLKADLADHTPALERMIFHAKLGSVAAKTERVTRLSGVIAKQIGADAKLAEHAASLAKADLATEMVGEFPELQGIMGRYYAVAQGEEQDVADAIAEHYKPTGAGDDVPTASLSVAVALADKLDSLTGLFAAGEKPTGSKDPFALRRAALSILRIILENRLSLSLTELIAQALKPLPSSLLAEQEEDKGLLAGLTSKKGAAVAEDVLVFTIDRLKHMLKNEGVRHDLITAVFATGEDDALRLVKRVTALEKLLGTDDGANLLAAYNRAANILAAEEKKEGAAIKGAPSDKHLEQAQEVDVYNAIAEAQPALKEAIKREEYSRAGEVLGRLRAPVDAFFDVVTVNAEDENLRKNRLRLLASLRNLCHQIADFSAIEG